MNDHLRLGDPLELPWWVFALALPAAVVFIVGLFMAAPLWAHGLAVVSSAGLVIGLVRVATHVESRNMQSVWVSVAMALWFFCAVTWVAAVMSAGN